MKKYNSIQQLGFNEPSCFTFQDFLEEMGFITKGNHHSNYGSNVYWQDLGYGEMYCSEATARGY